MLKNLGGYPKNEPPKMNPQKMSTAKPFFFGSTALKQGKTFPVIYLLKFLRQKTFKKCFGRVPFSVKIVLRRSVHPLSKTFFFHHRNTLTMAVPGLTVGRMSTTPSHWSVGHKGSCTRVMYARKRSPRQSLTGNASVAPVSCDRGSAWHSYSGRGLRGTLNLMMGCDMQSTKRSTVRMYRVVDEVVD